jgi:glycosyltransferase involved in cell wall biosynthesis
MSVLLSISIPTRNRADRLFDLLSDISRSLEHACIEKNTVNIFIFDNASTDSTPECIEKFSSVLPITYKRHSNNLGMGQNIYDAYTCPSGEYIWVIGDDDLVPLEGIKNIISIIRRNYPGLIILRELSYKGFIGLPKTYNNYSEFCHDADKNNPHYLIAHSLISANVIKKASFDSSAAHKYLSTYYGHMYGIASGFLATNEAVYLTELETIKVRQVYLGPVDGFWPESIELEQVNYLGWLKDKQRLNYSPKFVVSNYRKRLRPNLLFRAMSFLNRKVKGFTTS